MICCLNPNCQNPACPEDGKFCTECGTGLTLLESRYQPLRAIGRGGFGKTYLAKDIKKFGEQCVIKQFAPYGGNDSETEKNRFQDEAKQLQRLGEHPQIPDLLAFFTDKGYLYFVQQYVEGGNLAEDLESQGVYDEPKAREFLKDLLGILQVVHQQGIIHRDIKPYNIMRRRSDQKLVLIDFGISKQFEANGPTGTSIGSLGYSPLEQIWGGRSYPASDLYSLGVTAFYLMSGTSPHEVLAMTLENSSPDQAHNWVKQWRTLVKQPVSDGFAIVMDRLLENDHRQRYQSAAEVLAALDGKHTPAANPRPVATAIADGKAGAKKRWLWSIPLFLLAIGVAIVSYNSTPKIATTIGEVSKDLGDRPENATAYLERAKGRGWDDSTLQASLADLNQAILLQPKLADSYAERGQIRNRMKDNNGALADLDEAIKLRPDWSEAYYWRAGVYNDLSNTQKAIDDLNKAIELQNNNPLALVLRGSLLSQQGKKAEALKDLNLSIQMDSNSSYAYMIRAGIFASNNQKVEAIADYDKALAIEPNDSYYYSQRGILHQQLNNKTKAKADYLKTLELAKKEGKEKDYTDIGNRLKQVQ
jgi:Flp pilus assembly protein TadD/tRNA A-37 threonylcarbamoyl transferase component Bud32